MGSIVIRATGCNSSSSDEVSMERFAGDHGGTGGGVTVFAEKHSLLQCGFNFYTHDRFDCHLQGIFYTMCLRD